MRDYAAVFQCLLKDLGHCCEPQFNGPEGPRDKAKQLLKDSFYKKLSPLGENDEAADERALHKFLEINSRIRRSPFFYEVENELDMAMFDTFSALFERVCHADQEFAEVQRPRDGESVDWQSVVASYFGVRSLSAWMGTGPGMSIGAGSDDFFTKLFNSKLTTTSSHLLALYRAAIVDNDLWREAEKLRFNEFGVSICSANRLFFVPKNTEISRTCCTEPSLNMLVQKAIGGFLEACLRRHFSIDLATQPDRNREMARRGSEDGSLCTIDLKSASDSISNSLIKRLNARTGLNAWFRLARCDASQLPNGELVDLNMVSTMGNGFTFPLQTIIFACVVRAVYSLKGLPFDAEKLTYGVFGDDIVVRSDAYDDVVRMLHKLGFEVNETKSFKDGPFRESCGFDYFLGHQVRGVYVKSLETDPDIYSTINRLNRWSAHHGVSLSNTIESLRGMLGDNKLLLIPFSAGDHEGYKVPYRVFFDGVHREPKRNSYGQHLYKRLSYKARKRVVPIDKQGSDALGYAHYNEYGWGISFLGGYARTQWPDLTFNAEGLRQANALGNLAYLGMREKPGVSKHWKKQTAAIPYWDWQGVSDGRFNSSAYGGWQTLITLQFS